MSNTDFGKPSVTIAQSCQGQVSGRPFLATYYLDYPGYLTMLHCCAQLIKLSYPVGITGRVSVIHGRSTGYRGYREFLRCNGTSRPDPQRPEHAVHISGTAGTYNLRDSRPLVVDDTKVTSLSADTIHGILHRQ